MINRQYPLSIKGLEKAIKKKKFELAEDIFARLIIDYLEKRRLRKNILFNNTSNLAIVKEVESLSKMITLWFSNTNYNPSRQFYEFMNLQKNFLTSLFAASSYKSTDHILVKLNLAGKVLVRLEDVAKQLLFSTLDTKYSVPWRHYFKTAPEITILSFVGFLRSIKVTISPNVHKNIGLIIDIVDEVPLMRTRQLINLTPLFSVYFQCSNLTHDDKYKIKSWTARCFKQFLEDNLPKSIKVKVQEKVKTKIDKVKPKILVIHEKYRSDHAMYRGHHSRISALKDSFEVVGLALSNELDSISEKDFDSVVKISSREKYNYKLFIEKVIEVQPDIILYPSVGMSVHVPILASLRLAPIQIVSTGHPSSTYIDNIDYFHFPQMGQSNEEMELILSEKWLGYDHGGLIRKDINFEVTEINCGDEDETNIAVNGVIQKVGYEFIEICREITHRAKSNVKFHFFLSSGNNELEDIAAQKAIKNCLPNSILHQYNQYSDYMEILNLCDFAIPTMPFGGTNSNIDLVLLNKPKLYTLDKSDLPGMTDYLLWKLIGYTSGFCQSEEELIFRAALWSDNKELLKAEVNTMMNEKLVDRLGDKEEGDIKEEGLKLKFIELVEGH